jgi:hypothetical protein
LKRFVVAASFALALLGPSPAVFATPLPARFGQAPSAEHVSARILPRDFVRDFSRFPLAVLMQESIADDAAARLGPLEAPGEAEARGPFLPSPASPTLGETDVSEALRGLGDFREWSRAR